jgi:hypothetical protein
MTTGTRDSRSWLESMQVCAFKDAACDGFLYVVPGCVVSCSGPSTQGARLYSLTYALKRIGILISR